MLLPIEAFVRALASGEDEPTTNQTIVAELAHSLVYLRQYGLSHREAARRIRPYLAFRGLQMPNRALCLRAVDLFGRLVLDIEDAFAVARVQAEGMSEIVSYDKDFDRVSGMSRAEP